MKIIYLSVVVLLLVCSCNSTKNIFPDLTDVSRTEFLLTSDDSTLMAIFNWAVASSNQYVGNDTDPVGPWYEAALPAREAFCMRDVAHQCIAEELMGHGKQNANMMRKFVENISESKDFCSYWEINKHNLPAPVDYESDKDFWYNLNANFDVLQACLRLYKWTGNDMYLNDSIFDNFYKLSLNEYLNHWQLQPDLIMQRPAVMHEDISLQKPRFKSVRGLPSYEESVKGLRVTGDLIAVIYKGFQSYAEMLQIRGKKEEALKYARRAQAYAKLYNQEWWNKQTQNYYAYMIGDSLQEGGSNVYPLWFGIIEQPERVSRLLSIMADKETNVETMSYYPVIYYRNGENEKGYHFLNALYMNNRRDYPEVASGILEGIVCGLAGVEADAVNKRITTLPRLTGKTRWISIENISVFAGTISVLHESDLKTSFINKSGKVLTWRAMFRVNVPMISGKPATHIMDSFGNTYSYLDVVCHPGEVISLEAK